MPGAVGLTHQLLSHSLCCMHHDSLHMQRGGSGVCVWQCMPGQRLLPRTHTHMQATVVGHMLLLIGEACSRWGHRAYTSML